MFNQLPAPLRRLSSVVWVLAIMVLALLSATVARASDSFLEPEQAFVLTVDQAGQGAGTVRLNWVIAPGYYLYRDRIGVTATPTASLGKVERPAGETKNDPNFGAMQVYHRDVSVTVDAPGARELQVTWQGCAEAGLCYPPQTRKVTLAPVAAVPGAGAALPVALPTAPPTAPGVASLLNTSGGSDSRITQMLADRSLLWTVPLFFLLGIALAFTPCVLPMVPIVSGIVVGSEAPPRRAFALSLAFVLPMALVYALLGVAAALAGANLQAVLQNRWMLLAFGAVFVVLAGAMFGFFTLQLPAPLRDRLDRAGSRRQGGTLAGAAGLGALSALLVGPCMTAPLAGTLLYIAQSGNVAQGAVLLFALGLGMGLPLLVIGSLGARFLPRPGPWMERVKGAFGFMLLATAIWMVQRVLPESLVLAMWGALLLGLALTLVQSAAGAAGTSPGGGSRVLLRSAAAVAALWGGAMIVGAASGAGDPWQPLTFAARAVAGPAGVAQVSGLDFETVHSERELQSRLAAAAAAGQPVLVDFSADWCVSCKTIDKEVFGDPRVRQALAGVVRLRADVTASDADELDLMRRHQVIGPPTALLFDAQGRERRDARLVGEFTVDDLLQRQTVASGQP